MKKSNIIYNICEWILCICILINFRSIYLITLDKFEILGKIISLGITIFSFFCVILKSKIVLTKKIVLETLFIAIYFAVFMIISRYNTKSFTVFAIIDITLFWYVKICMKANYPSILKKFSKLVCLIAAVSLLFWIFGSILHIISPSNEYYSSWLNKNIKTYYGLYFEGQELESFFGIKHPIVRNIAIFAEAPMASFVFCIALIIEIAFEKKTKWKKIILLIFAIFSTLSTTGMLACIFLMMAKYVTYREKHKLNKTIKILFIPIIVIIAMIITIMFLNEKSNFSSGSIRKDDFKAGYLAWKRNILFGNGYYNDEIIINYMSTWRIYNTGFSNSIMRILAQGGIYLFMLYIIPFIMCYYRCIKKRKIKEIFIISTYLIIFSITAVSYQALPMLLLFYFGFNYESKQKLKNDYYI